MAIYQHVFDLPASSTTTTYSGFGSETVKAVVFLHSTTLTTDTTVTDEQVGFQMGYAAGTSLSQQVTHTSVYQWGTNTIQRIRMNEGECVSALIQTGAYRVTGYVSSMGTGEYDVTYDVNNSSWRVRVTAIVFTGANMLAKLVKLTPGTSTSNIVTTGVGFQPKLLMTMTSRESAASDPSDTGAGDTAGGVGMVDDAGNCFALGWNTDTAANPSNNLRIQDNGIATGLPFTSVSGWDGALTLSAMGSDGFTMSVPNAYASTRPVYILALGGSGFKAHIGDTTKTTTAATTTQDYLGASFTPQASMFFSLNSTAADNTPVDHFNMSWGATTTLGSTTQSAGNSTWDDAATSSASRRKRRTSTNTMILASSPSGSDTAIATFNSFQSAGTRLNWTTNDAVAVRLFYLHMRYDATQDYDERANPTVQTLAQTYGTISHIIRENLSTSRVNVLAQTYGTAVLNITQHLPVNTLTVQTYGTDYEAMKEHTNRVDVLAQTYGTIGLNVIDSSGNVQVLSQTYGSVSHLMNEHTNIVTVLVDTYGFSGITETGNPVVVLTQTYGTDRADYKELLYPNVVLVSTTGIGNHTASELAGLSTIIAQTYGNVAHQMVENAVIQTVLSQVYGIDSGLFLESSGPVVVDVETYGVAGMFSLEHSGPIVIDISTLGTDISNMLEYLNNVTVVVETLGFTIETEADGFVTVLVQTFGSDGFDLTFPVRYRVANLHTQNPYAVSLRVRR